MKQQKNYRVFLGVTEVCGFYSLLENGFQQLGIKCAFVSFSDHPYKYNFKKREPVLERWVRDVILKRYAASKTNILSYAFWLFIEFVLRSSALFQCLFKFDVFVFGYADSFLGLFDLPILKLFGKKIVFIFHGSDSRPCYISGLTTSKESGISTEECIKVAAKQKKTIKRIERYADVVINHPPTAHFHEKKFITWLRIGIPCFIEDLKAERPSKTDSRELRIVHAPSHPECKGTERIRSIIEKMHEKGHKVQLVELIGRPNREVLSELANCDFVIDELYSDTPMASLATEAALFAKPAIIGGYATSFDLGKLPVEEIPPSHYCHPDEIEKSIEKFILDESYRIQVGRKSYNFLCQHWSAENVTKRLQKVIENDFPDDWLSDPKDIRYVHGWGLPEDRAKELLRSVIQKGGAAALNLSDKPELEEHFIKFSN